MDKVLVLQAGYTVHRCTVHSDPFIGHLEEKEKGVLISHFLSMAPSTLVKGSFIQIIFWQRGVTIALLLSAARQQSVVRLCAKFHRLFSPRASSIFCVFYALPSFPILVAGKFACNSLSEGDHNRPLVLFSWQCIHVRLHFPN